METTKLYNDSIELVFNPAKHVYTIDNIPITNMTKYISRSPKNICIRNPDRYAD